MTVASIFQRVIALCSTRELDSQQAVNLFANLLSSLYLPFSRNVINREICLQCAKENLFPVLFTPLRNVRDYAWNSKRILKLARIFINMFVQQALRVHFLPRAIGTMLKKF